MHESHKYAKSIIIKCIVVMIIVIILTRMAHIATHNNLVMFLGTACGVLVVPAIGYTVYQSHEKRLLQSAGAAAAASRKHAHGRPGDRSAAADVRGTVAATTETAPPVYPEKPSAAGTPAPVHTLKPKPDPTPDEQRSAGSLLYAVPGDRGAADLAENMPVYPSVAPNTNAAADTARPTPANRDAAYLPEPVPEKPKIPKYITTDNEYSSSNSSRRKSSVSSSSVTSSSSSSSSSVSSSSASSKSSKWPYRKVPGPGAGRANMRDTASQPDETSTTYTDATTVYSVSAYALPVRPVQPVRPTAYNAYPYTPAYAYTPTYAYTPPAPAPARVPVPSPPTKPVLPVAPSTYVSPTAHRPYATWTNKPYIPDKYSAANKDDEDDKDDKDDTNNPTNTADADDTTSVLDGPRPPKQVIAELLGSVLTELSSPDATAPAANPGVAKPSAAQSRPLQKTADSVPAANSVRALAIVPAKSVSASAPPAASNADKDDADDDADAVVETTTEITVEKTTETTITTTEVTISPEKTPEPVVTLSPNTISVASAPGPGTVQASTPGNTIAPSDAALASMLADPDVRDADIARMLIAAQQSQQSPAAQPAQQSPAAQPSQPSPVLPSVEQPSQQSQPSPVLPPVEQPSQQSQPSPAKNIPAAVQPPENTSAAKPGKYRRIFGYN